MPSDHEIKQVMTEKGFPFFEGGGLNDLTARLEALEKLSEKGLKEIAAKKSRAAKDKEKAEERAAKKAVAKHKAQLKKDRKNREEKEEEAAAKKRKLSEEATERTREQKPEETDVTAEEATETTVDSYPDGAPVVGPDKE